MNRREFTRGLAALGLTPALPVPAIGAGSTGTAIATATADKMYFVGWYTARLNKSCSPQVLMSELNVNPDVAREIFGKLVKNNTVSAPNALGISKTVDPLSDSYRQVARKAAKRVLTQKSDLLTRDNLAKTKDALLEDEDLTKTLVEERTDLETDPAEILDPKRRQPDA